ncbi:MAG TPA: 4a-hydroxytetrahydrobiopterin dehydratase [Candidatus Paceibacterota bacterium]|nr:4a-hydroxytetrahydrobiopterin dehydratase [Candidatus Paceibacterota bacterium]
MTNSRFTDPSLPLADRKCVPCEGGIPPLTKEEAEKLMTELNGWMLVDEANLLAKSFRFKDFVETMKFVNKVADIAEEEGHHPDMTVTYGAVTIELMTHAIGGLSENDFIVAAKIDKLGASAE